MRIAESFLDIKVYNSNNDKLCSFDFTKLKKRITFGIVEYEVSLDIFPLDGCPKSDDRGIRKYYKRFNLIRIMKNSHFMKLENKTMLKKIIIYFLDLYPSNDIYQL
mgnify:CR=1 FL=1